MLHKDYEVAAFIQTVHGKHIFTVTHIPTHPNSGTDFYRHLSRQVFTPAAKSKMAVKGPGSFTYICEFYVV